MVEIKNVAIIGAGVMGHGIAQLALMGGFNVNLIDVDEEIVKKGVANVQAQLEKVEDKGKLGEGITTDALMANLKTFTSTAEGVKDADYVIEAATENMNIKKAIFKEADENSPAHAILASNTSTMSITEIGSATNRSDKVIGMHFFNPPALMRCIEIIAGDKTSDEAMDIGVEVGKKLACLRGKRFVPKVLKDRPGFIVNRMNAPVQIYMSWVFDQAKEKGVSWDQIDADGKIMPMGPCELSDYVGIDTMKHTMDYYTETLSPDFKPGKVLTQMVADGTLGAKTNKGFYEWPEGKRPTIDKSNPAGIFNLENAMAILLNEGCRILEEKIVTGFKVIDDANMAGMNTPGPFAAGRKNYEKWAGMLEKLAVETGKDYLKPCELMKSGGFIKMRR